jgi:lysozyme
MANLIHTINLICKYEGFNEKAYPDPETGGAPFTIGYGTQYYPDGSPVKQGHCCTKEKAFEYLTHEISCIDDDLEDLHLHIDNFMRSALISFIHSVGWKPFLYSHIIDCIEQENWGGVVDEMNLWIFDKNHHVIGNLLERRREEASLFLKLLGVGSRGVSNSLLSAFTDYQGKPHQVQAIKELELKINPYVLAEFTNKFQPSIGDYKKDFDGEWGAVLEY